MKEAIRKRLIQAALAITMGAAGVATYQAQQPSAEVLLAMELGAHFESSGRHIGTPYVDKLGKGQPLTVCNGVTGPEVVPGTYYTPDDCHRLELPKYLDAERRAKAALKHWGTYNVWVRASIIDMVYNLGPSVLDGTTLVRLGNAGDLVGMCQQMPRWVRGTVNGQSTVLPGLVDRRGTTRELCAEWGRDGHFSAGLIAEARP
ncbi:glycoside hydrolase family protein [Acidovorax sp. Leaf78]|uniref:glycoside hydrolase family protein n=1 Tax=Acidovorax sp. Leaf78 TaxID=1736237 RepID=UPI0006F32AC7|nr:glycoside hydrolase family protein [Acidovorax sp. Leaf78]KQO23507.1 endolysin [Acidovorax sp. Leaf78]